MFTANCNLVRNNISAERLSLTINQDLPVICLLCVTELNLVHQLPGA